MRASPAYASVFLYQRSTMATRSGARARVGDLAAEVVEDDVGELDLAELHQAREEALQPEVAGVLGDIVVFGALEVAVLAAVHIVVAEGELRLAIGGHARAVVEDLL